MQLFARAALCALSIFSAVASAQRGGGRICNNSPGLCEKSYGEITHLGAHNSAFVRDQTTSFSTSGNHYYNSTVQLQNGVRLLTAQLHKEDGQLKLCHSNCFLLDAGQLREWLGDIKTWMDNNPSDVVTILLVNADGATANEIAEEYEASGIDQFGYAPETPGVRLERWPTLLEMVNVNKRLVTFIADLEQRSERAPYLLNEFDYVVENKFDNTASDTFSCLIDRPSSVARRTPGETYEEGYLYIMNHFLYQSFSFDIDIPDEDRVNVTNSDSSDPSSLASRLAACTRAGAGRAPTFVMVDFFNVGPAIRPVDQSNGVREPQGRESVSTEKLTSQFSAASSVPQNSWMAAAAAVLAVAVAY